MSKIMPRTTPLLLIIMLLVPASTVLADVPGADVADKGASSVDTRAPGKVYFNWTASYNDQNILKNHNCIFSVTTRIDPNSNSTRDWDYYFVGNQKAALSFTLTDGKTKDISLAVEIPNEFTNGTQLRIEVEFSLTEATNLGTNTQKITKYVQVTTLVDDPAKQNKSDGSDGREMMEFYVMISLILLVVCAGSFNYFKKK